MAPVGVRKRNAYFTFFIFSVSSEISGTLPLATFCLQCWDNRFYAAMCLWFLTRSCGKYPNRPGLRKSKYTEQLTREDITELLTVANPGNPGGPLSLIFRPNWLRPEGPKKWFLETAPPPPLISGTPLPPYLKVWIRHWLKTKDVGKSRLHPRRGRPEGINKHW